MLERDKNNRSKNNKLINLDYYKQPHKYKGSNLSRNFAQSRVSQIKYWQKQFNARDTNSLRKKSNYEGKKVSKMDGNYKKQKVFLPRFIKNKQVYKQMAITFVEYGQLSYGLFNKKLCNIFCNYYDFFNYSQLFNRNIFRRIEQTIIKEVGYPIKPAQSIQINYLRKIIFNHKKYLSESLSNTLMNFVKISYGIEQLQFNKSSLIGLNKQLRTIGRRLINKMMKNTQKRLNRQAEQFEDMKKNDLMIEQEDQMIFDKYLEKDIKEENEEVYIKMQKDGDFIKV